jgi:hypothetical protein
VSRFVQATCRYFFFADFGPDPTRIGVSSPQMTRARMISARMVLFAAATVRLSGLSAKPSTRTPRKST